eukprot:7017568-Ditylum_brightwellii.AAC.1
MWREGFTQGKERIQADLVRYSGIRIDALEGHTLAFVGDMVNCQLPLLFSLTTGIDGTSAEKTLGLIRGAAALSLTPFVEYYVALGTADGLVPDTVGGAVVPVDALPPGKVLAMLES